MTKYVQSLLTFSYVFLARWLAEALSSDVLFKWLTEKNNKN